MSDWLKLQYKRIKRLPMHSLIRNLTTWSPLENANSGYTIVIGCMRDLAPLAAANLRLIGLQDLSNAREIVLVFDCHLEDVPQIIHDRIRELESKIKIRLIGYSKYQVFITHLINWGWVYSWLSWSTGVANANTKYVILHDLDAMPLKQDLFESIYQNIIHSGGQFHGVRQRAEYPKADERVLAATFELAIDIEYLRNNFSPFDVFNKLRMVDGQYVDFDTFLYIQWHSPNCRVTPIKDEDLVHPSQLICLYTDFLAGRNSFEKMNHNLLVLPYFMYFGGEESALGSIASRLSNTRSRSVPFKGKDLPIGGVIPQHWAWMDAQIRRLEKAQFGTTRPEVEKYLEGFVQRAGTHQSAH